MVNPAAALATTILSPARTVPLLQAIVQRESPRGARGVPEQRVGVHARLGPRAQLGQDSLQHRLARLVEGVVVDVLWRPSGVGQQATDLGRHVNRQREQLFRMRGEVPVDGRSAQRIVLGKRLVQKPHQPRAARRQRLPRNQQRGGGVPERQAGHPDRDVLERLHVVGDPVTRQLAGADERRLDVAVQGEIPGGDVQRFDESGAGAGHVHGVQRLRAEAPCDFGRGRRLERVARDPAVDEQVDIGCRHAILAQAGAGRARRELAG